MQVDDLHKEGKVSKEKNVLIPGGSRVSKHLRKGSVIITTIFHMRKMRQRNKVISPKSKRQELAEPRFD